ncbi:apolipoprotein N-acyltransferase [Endobacter medicaginis]|uniref:Apolipoprotein N-acyltransferase n=3 Tax=Endobacter medicaginis TaxID=1181271 RepID=A0A839V157_9PROT|nr:apolipoprotein N-acyltransferase [Endobacter medicaginis]MBB3174565.1 apolipoprotein N-acyltransferase [Endobacter medicaginis]MCX5474742.1 apolipoprotein N-acyltransferase [Endobacter medicaginis]
MTPVPVLARLRGWRADGVALLAGAVSALALPPVHAVPVLGLALPLLLLLVRGEDEPSLRARLVRAARCGFWFGMGLNTAGLYWLTNAILLRADQFWWLVPFASPLAAVPLAIAVMLPCLAVASLRTPSGLVHILVFGGVWGLADLVRGVIFTGFPWNLLGSTWEWPGRAGDVMIQPAAWIGTDGLSLVTVLLACLPLLRWRGLAAMAAVGLLWAGAGTWRLSAERPAGGSAPLMVLVQGNIGESAKLDRTAMVGIFRHYLDLTRRAMAGLPAVHGPVIVAWPETAFPGLLDTDSRARFMIAEAARGARAMLIGSVRFDDHDRPRNSVIALDSDGNVSGIYDKAHLVPFGEYQPRGLPVQIVPGGGFAAGPGPRTLDLPGIPPVGPLVCYEVIFPGAVTQPGDRPAWLLNLTNDAWYGDSAGPRQHLASARMRAVEEGLPLARDANTGISAVFDAYGRQTARLGWGVAGTLVAPLPPALPPTLFARFGLRIPLGLAVLCIALGLVRIGRGGPHRPGDC